MDTQKVMSHRQFSVITLLAVVVIVIAFGIYSLPQKSAPKKVPSPQFTVSPGNFTYDVGGEKVSLTNGLSHGKGTSTDEIAGLDHVAFGDVDANGVADFVTVVVKGSFKGSMYYYLVAVLHASSTSAVGTPGILLGNKITITKLSVEQGDIHISYLDRKAGEKLDVKPSSEVNKTFVVTNNTLVPKE